MWQASPQRRERYFMLVLQEGQEKLRQTQRWLSKEAKGKKPDNITLVGVKREVKEISG